MSIDNVMAIRNAILARNATLQNVTNSPPSATAGGVGGATTFDAAMTAALKRTDGLAAIGGVPSTGSAQQGGFAETLKAQVRNLNEINAQAGALTNAYERGEETDIAKVMLARQRSSIGFEATLQVRNKVLSAYKDIMSMAI